jgi:hypothetical protein
MIIKTEEFENALHGEKGELDAWLEVHNEEEVREYIKAVIYKNCAIVGALIEQRVTNALRVALVDARCIE